MGMDAEGSGSSETPGGSIPGPSPCTSRRAAASTTNTDVPRDSAPICSVTGSAPEIPVAAATPSTPRTCASASPAKSPPAMRRSAPTCARDASAAPRCRVARRTPLETATERPTTRASTGVRPIDGSRSARADPRNAVRPCSRRARKKSARRGSG